MDDQGRVLPSNDLDFNLMLTDSTWGRDEISPDLRNKLATYFEEELNGEKVITKASMWGFLSFLTRDLRLGNLSEWNNELQVCRFYLDLANDLLEANMFGAFLISLERTAGILETSQSKRGFLRKVMNTLRHESISETREPPKKGFFGGNKKNGGS